MEREASLDRKPPPMQELPPYPTKMKISRSWFRPCLTWSLVGTLILALIYVLRPNLHLPTSWIDPIYSQSSRPNEAEEIHRPRIALHPEDHIFRSPTTHYLDWRVTSGLRRPDGVLKQIFLINGPTVEARSGDTLHITVTNAVDNDEIALHWHGLHVANAMDGAVGISQCPIAPGGKFTYKVTIPSDQSGTFWYHAHAGLSRAEGLYGGLVVHAPASSSTVRGLRPGSYSDLNRYGYEKELLLLVGDWYHQPAKDVLEWFKAPGNFGNEPVPDSLLVNGVGHFQCAMAAPARPVDCVEQRADYSFLDIDPNTTYRIRVVNTGSLAGFSLVFDKEQLDLIQVDSINVEPLQIPHVNSLGILQSGQRMDFILHPSSNENGSSMEVKLDEECFKYSNPALTPTQTFPIKYGAASVNRDSHLLLPSLQVRVNINLDETPSSRSALRDLSAKAEQAHVVYTKIQKMARNHNSPLGFFNQTSWSPQQDPHVPLIGLPRTKWDANQFAITTGSDPVWVDLVVNNLDEGSHPFHLHGHHFYIMTVQKPFGWGSYNPFKDSFPPGLEQVQSRNTDDSSTVQPYDLSRVALRDTVQIPSRGYAVLRFRADNPGIWLFHCHVLWHHATGMAMLVDIGGSDDTYVHDRSVQGVCPGFK
ncbi:hypothetical protein N7456_012305 [Penicillium angulare]|uniref:Multicopper oxidase n=1 Tax=Penicillium angulare TaxID=116970 RepID=A0A9W9EVJ7_9EURO|nr:hypothetical protein N7456_012305 [Penicillium angulare]